MATNNPNNQLTTNAEGIQLLKSFEGLLDGDPQTVALNPYLCPAGYWTIGFGHVILDPSGRMLHGREMKPYAYAAFPNGISRSQADILLVQDAKLREAGVKRLVKVQLTPNQFSACVSFSFNVGLDEDADTIAEGFGDSTLLKLINQGKFSQAALEFEKWISKGSKFEAGLRKRRLAEKQLFLKP